MPRPLRVEFENAHYHVMNRSVAGRSAFTSPQCYQDFLDILGKTCFRYGLEVHTYCLIHNQYHLLIKTPKGNLSRVMRHINGVYTQHYNDFNGTDGPLFKGRFKAVLVEYGDTFLKLSKYIHCRPIAIKKPVVKKLIDYPWSSFPAYIGQAAPIDWLSQGDLLAILEGENKPQSYADYMASEVDENILQLYDRSHLPSIIGSKKFKASVACATNIPKPHAQSGFTLTQIISGVAAFYDVTNEDITRVVRGAQKANHKRKLAMYMCQELTGAKLTKIADAFNLSSMGAASHATHSVRQLIKDDSEFKQQVEELIKYIQQYSG